MCASLESVCKLAGMPMAVSPSRVSEAAYGSGQPECTDSYKPLTLSRYDLGEFTNVPRGFRDLTLLKVK